MKRRTQITLRVLAALLVGALVAGVWFYVQIWAPHRRFYRNETWWSAASTNEIRDLCHHIISHRPGAPHDAFLHLRRSGNAESVPLLIQALGWQKPEGKELVSCTTAHCLDALRSLTGEDLGYSPTEWEQWWKDEGSRLPADLERTLRRLPEDYVRISVGGDILLMNKKTRYVFDVVFDVD